MKKYIFSIPIYCMLSFNTMAHSFWGTMGDCATYDFNKLTPEQKQHHLNHEPHPCSSIEHIKTIRAAVLKKIDLSKANGDKCRLSIKLDLNGNVKEVIPLNKNEFCFYAVGQTWGIDNLNVPPKFNDFTIGIQ